MYYKHELFAQKTPYLQWLIKHEKELTDKKTLGKHVYRLPFYTCMDNVHDIIKNNILCDNQAVYIFTRQKGYVSQYVDTVMSEVFLKDENIVFAYADEDYLGNLKDLYDIEEREFEDNILIPYRFENTGFYRGCPWFKPDFSPDTLESFFYIGSVFAIRGDVLFGAVEKYGKNVSLYEFIYKMLIDEMNNMSEKNIIHIPSVLYTNPDINNADKPEGMNELKAIGLNIEKNEDLVSVIIPSKDNSDVLEKCIGTLTKYTVYKNYEIIIVDNGSCDKQRVCIKQLIENIKEENNGCNIKYIYEKMDFNFSKMCNIGADMARGKYLLFLNDDIEVMDTDKGIKWLNNMIKYAKREHVGAVGAKLYYPNENEDNKFHKIQHAGITNMVIGPAHKLCGMNDEGCLYHGHNMLNYDMIAVTAACMLVKKADFYEVNGFDEEFAVAYNDVEFCFKLYEKGLYNVQVNEAVLIHHESLSRGSDTSPDKQRRLYEEKRKLYKKHPLLNGKDPYYSSNLVQTKKDVWYNVEYLYECDCKIQPKVIDEREKKQVLKKYDFRNILYSKCNTAGKVYDRFTKYNLLHMNIDNVESEDSVMTINGWQINTKKLWLIRVTRDFEYRKVYEFDILPKLREDVAALFGDTDAALSGIQLIFDKNDIMKGTYKIGVVTNKRQLLCDEKTVIDIGD